MHLLVLMGNGWRLPIVCGPLMPGHAPGHMGYVLDSPGDDRILFCGDLIHVPAAQFARPATWAYDDDPSIARYDAGSTCCASCQTKPGWQGRIWPGIGKVVEEGSAMPSADRVTPSRCGQRGISTSRRRRWVTRSPDIEPAVRAGQQQRSRRSPGWPEAPTGSIDEGLTILRRHGRGQIGDDRPGAIALTRMPFGVASHASAREVL